MKIRGFFALLWAGLLAAVAAFAGQPVAELYDKAEYRIAIDTNSIERVETDAG